MFPKPITLNEIHSILEGVLAVECIEQAILAIAMKKIIDHFEIEDNLGAENVGTVHRARDIRLARDVAIKLLPENLAANPVLLQKFQRDARAASALTHPNICTIYEIGEYQGQYYIVMELLEGQTLRSLMRGKPLPTDQIISLASQIAAALEVAHSKEIVHRDIKPANIFVTPRGHVKICDFGLSQPASALGFFSATEQTSCSPQPGATACEYKNTSSAAPHALPYMSPEQALGEDLDPRSDLFSLGCVLYEAATGILPFTGDSQQLLFQQILTKMPAAPLQLNPALLPRMDDLIRKLIEKDRELRYQTVGDLCADLKRLKRDIKLHRAIPAGQPDMPAPPATGSSNEPAQRAPALRAPAVNNTIVHAAPFFRHFRILQKPKAALPMVAAVVLLAIASFYFFGSSLYFPCIKFENFTGGSESVNANMISFMLRRSLSQFPEITVLRQREFDSLLAIDKSRKKADRAKPSKPNFLQRLIPWKQEMRKAAVVISGQVSDSVDSLEVRLDCVVRGKKETLVNQFRGVDDLLNRGIDSMAKHILNRFDAGIADRHIYGKQPDYRTVVQLLSPSWDALRHYGRGAGAWERLDMNSAEREMRSALEIDPHFALAHLMLGEVRVFQNQWDTAQSEILAARKRPDSLTDADQLRVEAFLARVFGKPFDEREALRKLIELQRYKREYLYELAESYFHTADVREAISQYQNALSLDSKYALAYNHLGYCYSWKGEHAKALEVCRQYLELDTSANAYDSFGDAYMRAGNYPKAEEMKSKAIQMDPHIYYANRNLAFIHMLRGRNKSAAERLTSLIAATDDRVQRAHYYAALAFLHYWNGEYELAKQICEQNIKLLGSIQYDAPHDELIWLIGMSELRQQNLEAARRQLLRLHGILENNLITAMNYKPAYKYYLHLHAWLLAKEGKPQEASAVIDDLKWIKDKLGYWKTPFDQAFFLDAIGQIYEIMNRATDAQKAYEESLAYNPHCAFARLHLARLLRNMDSQDGARREMKLFLEDWRGADSDAPESVEAKKIMAGLGMTK
jgi:eukaryotic-like serine/threonine-protein kinase